MSPRGVAGNAPPSGNPAGRAAFALGMRRLAEVEALPVYAEMCAAAAATRAAEAGAGRYANGQLAEKTEAQKAAHPRTWVHGLIATYNNGCHCAECRAVAAERKRNYRARASA